MCNAKCDDGYKGTDLDLTCKNYLTPVDLKKNDIGRAMIHAETEDFKEDQSSKNIMEHRAQPLTNRQKEIGSSAPF